MKVNVKSTRLILSLLAGIVVVVGFINRSFLLDQPRFDVRAKELFNIENNPQQVLSVVPARTDTRAHPLSGQQRSSEYIWPTVSGSPANKEEMDKWAYARGFTYRFASKQQDYESYNDEVLEALIKTGDIHAMQTLATRIGGTEGIPLFKQAAVYGSVSALQSIAIRIDNNRSFEEYEGTLPANEKHQQQLESKAYYEVAGLRGDEETRRSGDTHFYDVERVQFTSAEQEIIKARAQQIYAELEQQRITLGLGKFDNSVPDSVKRYFTIFRNDEKK